MIVVPHEELKPDVLEALIQEFLTRDGAVHGHHDVSLKKMTENILRQLVSGKVVIVFDEDDESCSIVSAKDLPADSARVVKDSADSSASHFSDE